MSDMITAEVKALAEAKPGKLFVDQDGDVCIDDGRQFNLIFCPATDDGDIENGWPVLNPDVVAELVTRFNAAPDLARTVIALHARLAAAEAQVGALTKERDEAVELAEERLRGQHRLSNQLNGTACELNARLAALQEALEFYANKEAWSQPPVRTREGLLSIEYENQASKVQRDRGKIARAALNMEAANG